MSRPTPQLITLLKADTAVSAEVGAAIFADYPPQGQAEPFVVLTTPSGTSHGTVNNCQTRAYSARLNVDVVCDTRAQTESTIEAIEDVLDGHSSTDSTHPIQGVTIESGIQWEMLTPKDGSDKRVFICTQDYLIHYRRNL